MLGKLGSVLGIASAAATAAHAAATPHYTRYSQACVYSTCNWLFCDQPQDKRPNNPQ